MELCFATNNRHKLEEVAARLSNAFTLKTLKDIGCTETLPETMPTIAGNSRQKAEYVWTHHGISCFADDTGLEVDALNGEPGVYSARYAALQETGSEPSHTVPQSDTRNIQVLLRKLNGIENRKARFRTVITLLLHGVEHQFEGIVEGTILQEPRGDKGFGYDPVFIPEGHDRTFAEMDLNEKNQISHRARALDKLIAYLREQL